MWKSLILWFDKRSDLRHDGSTVFSLSLWWEKTLRGRRTSMTELIRKLWVEDAGQDIAEYAVMLAVILVLVVGTIRLIGSNANNVFSNTASSIQ
jgi:Flp pilus assembly pilin Flp